MCERRKIERRDGGPSKYPPQVGIAEASALFRAITAAKSAPARRPRGLTLRCRGPLLLFAFVLGSISSALGEPSLPKPWSGFQVIMWQTKTERQYQALKALGVTAARLQADRVSETAASAERKALPIVRAGLRPYVENIATDFYSAYHRWVPGKPINAAFLDVQRAIAQHPNDTSVFIRQPGLSDARALGRIKKRLKKIVRLYAPYRPLFFNLGDEMGIADLSAAWDFDFSNSSLSAMRRWLRTQYGTLDALNAEWGTQFARWRNVRPPTTTETMQRKDGNYAAWSDFKAWMDVAFARAVRAGAQAVHAGAPWARAAVEGAQMPGWGGYDYTLLASSVDVMDLYDAGESLDFARTFNPRLLPLMTVNWAHPGAIHQAWRELLRGMRGMVIWDQDDRFVNPDGTLGPDGHAAAPFLKDVQGRPANLIMSSRRVRAPIAVLYSPESYRLQWLLDHRAMGAAWTRLGSEDQNADNAVRATRRRMLGLLDSLGLSPHFISVHDLAEGKLERAHDKVVVLSNILALSDKMARRLRAFVQSGGILVASGQIGSYDGHGRRLSPPRLSALLDGKNPRAISLSADDGAATRQFAKILKSAAITPAVQVAIAGGTRQGTIERYIYRRESLTIVALLANPSPGQAQASVSAQLSLPRTAYVYDIRVRRRLAHARALSVAVESTRPTVLILSDNPLSTAVCQSVLRWQTCPTGRN